MFNGKTHYKLPFFDSYVKLPEGMLQEKTLKNTTHLPPQFQARKTWKGSQFEVHFRWQLRDGFVLQYCGWLRNPAPLMVEALDG